MALTNKEYNYALAQLRMMIEDQDLEYADNYRFAEVGDPNEEEAYQQAVEKGCCGSFDDEIQYPVNGKRIAIGCNHGH
jgi:hypothetical protein